MLLGPGQFIFFSYCSIKSLTKSLLSYSHITPNSRDVFFLMIKNLCFFGLKYCTPPRSEKCGSRASFFPYCSTLILILFALKYSAPGLARKMQVDRASFFSILFNKHNVDVDIDIVCAKVFCPSPPRKNAFGSRASFFHMST